MRIARMLTAVVALVALSATPATADDTTDQRSELGAASGAAASDVCHYLQFCIYANEGTNGIVARLQSCTLHDVRGKRLESYINNQTPGTRARFYNSQMTLLSYSKPAPDWGTIAFDVGLNTAYVRPC